MKNLDQNLLQTMRQNWKTHLPLVIQTGTEDIKFQTTCILLDQYIHNPQFTVTFLKDSFHSQEEIVEEMELQVLPEDFILEGEVLQIRIS